MADRAAGDTLYIKFTTRDSNVPATLSGTPAVKVYKDDSTTESAAGITLTVDFDSVTGLNHVSIDTSADGTFYANGHHYELVITTGTVGGTSVVGEVVGKFDLASATVAANVTQWSGSNVAAPATAGYPVVTHKVGTGTGEINLSAGKVPATLASTDVSGNLAADLQTIKTQAITCSAAVTVNPNVGTATAALVVDASGRVQVQAGTSTGQIALASGAVTVGTLPAIPAGWITAAGIAAAALNGKGDWLLASTYTAAPTVGAIDAQLSSTHGAGAWGGVSLTDAVPATGNTANTVADCLNAARAGGFGKWALSGTTLTLYAPDGTTAVRSFTLDSATAPTSRT